jgi:hypothetical protein
MRPTAVRHGLLIIWRQSSLAQGPGSRMRRPGVTSEFGSGMGAGSIRQLRSDAVFRAGQR